MPLDLRRHGRSIIGFVALAAGVSYAERRLFSPQLDAARAEGERAPALAVTATHSNTDARIATLERQVAVLTQELIAHERNEKDMRAAFAAAQTQEEQKARVAEELSLPLRERVDRAQRDLYETLDRQLANGAPDAAWRPEAAARETLSQFSGTRMMDIDCTATFCRVHLSHDSDDARQAVNGELTKRDPFREGTAFRYDASEPLRTTLYFQRPGFELGSVEPIGKPQPPRRL